MDEWAYYDAQGICRTDEVLDVLAHKIWAGIGEVLEQNQPAKRKGSRGKP